MPSPDTVWLVAGAAVLLWVLPGPALLLLLTRGIDLGARGAIATAFGLGAGTAVHVVAAAVGLSAVLTASAAAFTVVKVLGGLYLVWLGVQRWRDDTPLVPERGAVDAVPAGRPFRRSLAEGFMINALNPKVAVFFLAFLPPFVDVDRGAPLTQTLVLGLVVSVVLLAGDVVFAATTGSVGRRMVHRLLDRRRDRRARRLVASVYVGLGVVTLATGDGRT